MLPLRSNTSHNAHNHHGVDVGATKRLRLLGRESTRVERTHYWPPTWPHMQMTTDGQAQAHGCTLPVDAEDRAGQQLPRPHTSMADGLGRQATLHTPWPATLRTPTCHPRPLHRLVDGNGRHVWLVQLLHAVLAATTLPRVVVAAAAAVVTAAFHVVVGVTLRGAGCAGEGWRRRHEGEGQTGRTFPKAKRTPRPSARPRDSRTQRALLPLHAALLCDGDRPVSTSAVYLGRRRTARPWTVLALLLPQQPAWAGAWAAGQAAWARRRQACPAEPVPQTS